MKVNTKNLRPAPVPKPMFGNEYGLENYTLLRNPTPERRYIKLMAQCLDYQTVRELFPNTTHAVCHQLRDLCRLGYIERYELIEPNGQPGPNPYVYRTTPKGLCMVIKAYNNVQLQ